MENQTNVEVQTDPTWVPPPPRTKFYINADRFGEFESKITKLNKRATKLGCAEATYTVVDEDVVFVRLEDGLIISKNEAIGRDDVLMKRRIIIELDAPATRVKYEGWEFVGKIEALEGGMLLSAMPGKEISESYRTAKVECEHCKTSRRRKFTYIVRHDSGETKQIGHQCIRDFLGHKSPESIASIAETLIRFGNHDEFGGYGAGEKGLFLNDILAMSTAIARLYGWVSKSTEYKTPTMVRVFTQLYNRKTLESDERVVPTEADVAMAQTIVDWLRSGLNTEGNQYLTNLALVGANDFVLDRHVGLIGSAYIAYDKVVGDPLKFKPVESEIKNEHFGTIKKREEFVLTVMETREMRNDFGTTTLIKFLDSEKRLAIWFASGYKVDEYKIGDTFRVKATIKKHDSYKGAAQTALTRVTVIKKIEEEAA